MAVSFAALVRAFDAALALGDAARRVRGRGGDPDEQVSPPSGPETFSERIEARLSSVVVAALKEAFDRDHARLELEREHLEEQRRRAEAARRLELRRLGVDREIARLRWLGATALVSWIATVLVLGLQLGDAPGAARLALGVSWALLLGALASAFSAQGSLAAADTEGDSPLDAGLAGRAALWLLVSGLALVTLSLLL